MVLKFGLWNVHKTQKNPDQIHAFEPEINPCYGQLEQQENSYNKHMLWSLDQQVISCYGIRATSKCILCYLEQRVNSCYVFRRTRDPMT